METSNKKLQFEVSYTLDILCFIDQLVAGSLDEDITYYGDQLGSVSEKCLKKIKKSLSKYGTLQTLVIPLIVADPDFNEITAEELLANPKYLITKFKQSPNYKHNPANLKSFVNNEAKKTIASLAIIVTDLERIDFKSFWLSDKLPGLKSKVKKYEEEYDILKVEEQLGNWVSFAKDVMYVLAFAAEPLLEASPFSYLISDSISVRQQMSFLVDEVVFSQSIAKGLSPVLKRFKKDKNFALLCKKVKKEYPTPGHYLQKNLFLALTAHLNKQFNTLVQPLYKQPEVYDMSHRFYEMIKEKPKLAEESLIDYFLDLLANVELEDIY